MPDLDGHALIEALRRRDDRAFNALVQRYQRDLYHMTVAMLDDAPAAMDLVQEVFVGVFKERVAFERESELSTWLFCRAADLCARRLARRGLASRRGNRAA